MGARERLRWVFLVVVALSACGCSQQNAASPPWVEVSSDLNNPGASTVLHFTVGQAQASSGRRAMIAIIYPQSQDGTVEHCVRRSEPAFRVAVIRSAAPSSVSIAVEDDRTILAHAGKAKAPPDAGPASAPDIARVALATTDGKTALALIAGFRAAEAGSYTATITPLDSKSCFKGVATRVTVGEFYNTGK